MRIFKILSIGLAFFSFVFAVHAQTDKGNVLLGGESKLNFTSINSSWDTDNHIEDYGRKTDLEFSPQIGFFVANGLAFGVEIPIMYSVDNDGVDNLQSSTSIAAVPFLRLYFGKSNIKPYLHGGLGVGKMKSRFELSDGYAMSQYHNLFLYEIGGGFGIFLNEKVSLDFGLGYASISKKQKDVPYSIVRNSSGIAAGIGIVVVL